MGDPIKRIERKAKRSVFRAFLASASRMGGKTVAIIDGDGKKFTYKDISRAAFALGGPIARMTQGGEKVGIMLPTGAAAAIAFFAVQSRGRAPAMLNFTSGVRNLIAAGRAAEVTKVLTAHKFIEIGKLEGLIEARGFGLIKAPFRTARLVAVVDLATVETKRLPDHHETVIANEAFPTFRKVENASFPAMLVAYLNGGRVAP